MAEQERRAPAPGDTVAIAADHAGVGLKVVLAATLRDLGFTVLDFGTEGPDSVDYPDFAKRVADAVAGTAARWGVLVCGSGIGMSIAANRNPAVRAALVHDVEAAKLAREHNDANVLALGARFISEEAAKASLKAFLATAFAGGRHDRRVGKLGT